MTIYVDMDPDRVPTVGTIQKHIRARGGEPQLVVVRGDKFQITGLGPYSRRRIALTLACKTVDEAWVSAWNLHYAPKNFEDDQ